MVKIAIDVMGSDLGPKELLKGVRQFKEKYPNVELFVVGKLDEIEEAKDIATLVEASDVMGMEDGALEVMRKKNTSMLKAVELVKEGKCDGVVSAGSTGAFLTASTIRLKLIEGISRAALISPFPRYDGKAVTILDIGANNENTPHQIYQFAVMGALYSSKILNAHKPKLYLLSNGSEEKKGSPLIKEAHQLLKEHNFPNFMGNIEARDVLTSEADVVVTGGFEGNILLKSIEGTASMMNSMIKNAFKKSAISKIGYLFAKSGFDEMREKLDYRRYGGAMLVGLNNVVVKAHGSSNAYAFFNAIRVAKEMVEQDVISLLKEELKNGIKEEN
ncbi:TPA: phosphate acyltransferase PlsX [bacterium]|nr:phosphate acyltransferase PlsX [bacterium]